MRIIIFTKNFSERYTGATASTYALVEKWAENVKVKYIRVITRNAMNQIKTNKIYVSECKSYEELKNILEEYSEPDDVYYSDDHTGFLLNLFHKKYIHTYHGNWPDARFISIDNFIKSLYFMPLYKKTIKSADCIINVSNYMEQYTKKICNKSIVVRNGTNKNIVKRNVDSNVNNYENRCLMIGNIDKRKYSKLLEVLKELEKNKSSIKIDIYGNIVDLRLARKLKSNKRVTIKGFTNIDTINFDRYLFLLSTSKMENMPISIVEMIKAKIPIVGFSVGGINEVVNASNGRLFALNEVEQMAKTIIEIEMRKILFDFSCGDVSIYDWSIAAQKYLEIFSAVFKENDYLDK